MLLPTDLFRQIASNASKLAADQLAKQKRKLALGLWPLAFGLWVIILTQITVVKKIGYIDMFLKCSIFLICFDS